MTTLLGGDVIEVTYRAADAFDEITLKRLVQFQPLLGTKERVKVRQVIADQMTDYGNAVIFNNEARQLEIYCGRDPGWANLLTPESHNAVADKGLEINLPFFGAWYQRQAKWKEQQTPPALEKAMTELQRKMTELQAMLTKSASASPNSASSSSHSATG
jgi:hypothetical protein